MACDFMSFAIVFQSNKDDGRIIMKGCLQWNPAEETEPPTGNDHRPLDQQVGAKPNELPGLLLLHKLHGILSRSAGKGC